MSKRDRRNRKKHYESDVDVERKKNKDYKRRKRQLKEDRYG